MAIYKVIVITRSVPFSTGSNNWEDYFTIPSNATNYRFHQMFKNTEQRIILIEDDDNSLDSGHNETGELSQTLVEDFNFGWPKDNSEADLVRKGTQISRMHGRMIVDEEGNAFLTVIPYPYVSQKIARNKDDDNIDFSKQSFGGKKSMLIFPLSQVDLGNKRLIGLGRIKTYKEREDSNGDPIPSVFDKNAKFGVAGDNGRHIVESPLFNYPPQKNPPVHQTASGSPPTTCFAEGSLLLTPQGLRAVETLRKGDLVVTRDKDVQPILWVGNTSFDRQKLARTPKSQPILIRKGAFGHNLPDRDLMVSPQHRVLVRSIIAQRMFGVEEVLVAAKHLLDLPGVEITCPDNGINYLHILLPEHDLVLSHGTWTESFFVGAYTLQTLGDAAKADLFTALPDLARPDYAPRPARRLLTGREGRKLAERHMKNCKPLIAEPIHLRLRALGEETIPAL